MRWAISATAIPLLLGGGCMPLAFGDPCRYQDTREAAVPTDGASGVRIVARAGDLRVTGHAGLTEARISGTACGSTRAALESVRLIAERRGPLLWIEADIPDAFQAQQRRLDLIIELPDSLPIEASDSSGDVEVSDVASLQLNDSSGDIEIAGVAGRLEIEDSSGDITVHRVEGDTRIDDSSGDMEIRAVSGTVRIRDRSGDIEVADVKGELLVEQDGSGDVRYSNIVGQVSVPKRR